MKKAYIPLMLFLFLLVLIGAGYRASDSLLMGWNGTFWRPVSISERTRAMKTITHTQSEILDGNHYYIEGWVTLGDGETLFVQLRPPAASTGKVMHLTWRIQSSGVLETYLLRDASGGMLGGTAVTPINSDHNSPNTSEARFWRGCTTATSGTTVANSRVGAATFKGSVGGDPSRDDMIAVKTGVSYFRAFKSFTATNNISFRAGWYEHTNEEK